MFGKARRRSGCDALTVVSAVLRSLSNRMTVVLRRRDGEWKVVHEHTSAPIEHETLKARLQRA